MTKKLGLSNAIVFALVALALSLYVIFFTGRVTDEQTGRTSRSWFTPNGVSEFRLGMDVSGGVRLTYKVDFTKYDHLYPILEESEYMKKNAITIIKKQIDKRVSVLGVSDYQAYTKKIDEEYYIIVELGGVHSLEEAKEIIGKTVELEFKVAYDEETDGSPEMTAMRQEIVNTIGQQLKDNPENFDQIGQGKESDDIFYQKFTKQSIQNLPSFFTLNEAKILSMESGSVSTDPIEGIYTVHTTQDENGNATENVTRGYTFVKFAGVEDQTIELVNLEKIQSVSENNGFEYKTTEEFDNYELEKGTYKYDEANRQLIHNLGDILIDEVAYKAEIYAISKGDRIGKTPEEIEEIAEMTESEDTTTAEITTAIENGETIDREDTTNVTQDGETWVSLANIQSVIPAFAWTGQSGIQTFDTLDARFIVSVSDIKEADQTMYAITRVSGVSSKAFDTLDKELSTDKLISAEVIFVKDSPSWVPAIDATTNQVLNGAYFQRARLDTTQGTPTVAVDFDETGKRIFCNITREYVQEQMAIFVGGELQTAPVIQEEICGGTAVINGQESVTEARALVDGLNEGALPAPLLLANEEKVSPVLGERALAASLIAGGLGVLVIFLMLWFMYGHRKALVGTIVIIAFLIYLMALLKIFDYAFSLSGIAAIILSLGMGIDANILIFERVREELTKGKHITSAIDKGYERSRNPIRDGNVSTIMIALFLLLWGLGVFKGFGSVMVFTILMILFVNVPLTKHLLDLFFSRKKEYLNDK